MIYYIKKIFVFSIIKLFILNNLAWSNPTTQNESTPHLEENIFTKSTVKNCIAPKTNFVELGIKQPGNANLINILISTKHLLNKNIFFKTKFSDYFLPITISLCSLSFIFNNVDEKQKTFLFVAKLTTIDSIATKKFNHNENIWTKIKNELNKNHIIFQIVKKYWVHYIAIAALGLVILRFQSAYLKGNWWSSMDSFTCLILIANMIYAVVTFLFGDYIAQKINFNDINAKKDQTRMKVMGIVGFVSKIPYLLYLGLFLPYSMIFLKNNFSLNETFDPLLRFFIHQFIWLYPYNAFRYYIRDFLYLLLENSINFKEYVLKNFIQFAKNPFKLNKLNEALDEFIRLITVITLETYYDLKKQFKPVHYWDIFSPLIIQYIGHTIFIGPTMLAIFLISGNHAFILSSIITVYHVMIISHLMFLKKEQKIPNLLKDSNFKEWIEKHKNDKEVMHAWNQFRLYMVARDLSLQYRDAEKIIKNGLENVLLSKFKNRYYPNMTSYEKSFNRIENLYLLDREIQAAA